MVLAIQEENDAASFFCGSIIVNVNCVGGE
jgi:hypothetical protein